MNANIKVNAALLRHGGAFIVETLDNRGNVVAVTRFAVLHLGENGRDVIEIRTETKTSKSEHRMEVSR
jgi:hypothetical protein